MSLKSRFFSRLVNPVLQCPRRQPSSGPEPGVDEIPDLRGCRWAL